MKPGTLKEILTDFVSMEPASLGKAGYGHSARIANELGYTGFRSHLMDLGGASVTGALGQAIHSEYFMFKGDFATPAGRAGDLAFSTAGIEREEIDYAWIYDCFVGMIILQSSEYFGVSKKEISESLKKRNYKIQKW
ncbi:hypothetical protein LEP1GSC088_4411 [Leptospira interrogans str. L1207]|nr:hypothetical protein LEP1GSC088_4411 [Leptospira interrogans str. L1207]